MSIPLAADRDVIVHMTRIRSAAITMFIWASPKHRRQCHLMTSGIGVRRVRMLDATVR